MKNARLTRIAANPDHGVFGSLVLDGMPICNTLEPYHRENERNISCIPAGSYICKKVKSPKYGKCFEVTEIHGRSNILMHWGNVDDHTEGCIILGEKFGLLDFKWAVLESKAAFNEFMELTKEVSWFRLVITEAY